MLFRQMQSIEEKMQPLCVTDDSLLGLICYSMMDIRLGPLCQPFVDGFFV